MCQNCVSGRCAYLCSIIVLHFPSLFSYFFFFFFFVELDKIEIKGKNIKNWVLWCFFFCYAVLVWGYKFTIIRGI